jgi:hypothetical protein
MRHGVLASLSVQVAAVTPVFNAPIEHILVYAGRLQEVFADAAAHEKGRLSCESYDADSDHG